MERWCPIPGHERYLASTLGLIRGPSGVVLKPWITGRKAGKLGYQTVEVDGLTLRVHQLMALTYLGPPMGREVRHRNGHSLTNRLDNLEYGTRAQNAQDMVRHGTQWQQSKTHCPRLHLLTGVNLDPVESRKGHRGCLACRQARRYTKRHPELNLQEEADRRYRLIMG
jgi:hypothetical protein